MDLGIRNKRALVTGTGKGLGASIAACLSQEGAQVAVVSRNQRNLDNLVNQMGGKKAGHTGLAMDLIEDSGPSKLVDSLKKDGFWPLDIVVHNLGGNLDIADPFCSLSDWRKVTRFNLEVAVELNLSILPEMQKRKWGRVVHISSIASMENQGTVPYCSMKAALNAYTRSMGRVVAADGVVMTSVLPGAVFTEGGYWDKTSKERPQHVQKYLSERMAIKRFGRLEEIGWPVAFLCSEWASFFIGSVIPIDGGQGRCYFVH